MAGGNHNSAKRGPKKSPLGQAGGPHLQKTPDITGGLLGLNILVPLPLSPGGPNFENFPLKTPGGAEEWRTGGKKKKGGAVGPNFFLARPQKPAGSAGMFGKTGGDPPFRGSGRVRVICQHWEGAGMGGRVLNFHLGGGPGTPVLIGDPGTHAFGEKPVFPVFQVGGRKIGSHFCFLRGPGPGGGGGWGRMKGTH